MFVAPFEQCDPYRDAIDAMDGSNPLCIINVIDVCDVALMLLMQSSADASSRCNMHLPISYTVVAVIITVLIPRNYMAVTLLITVL